MILQAREDVKGESEGSTLVYLFLACGWERVVRGIMKALNSEGHA